MLVKIHEDLYIEHTNILLIKREGKYDSLIKVITDEEFVVNEDLDLLCKKINYAVE